MPKTLETETESLHLSRAAGPVFVLHASRDQDLPKMDRFSASNSANI